MKIIWSPLAIDRVEEIAGYIAQDNPSAAGKWAVAIFHRVKQIGAFPNSGRMVPEAHRQELREIIYGNYRIIYRIDPRRVSILTVRHLKQILPLEETA
ncbi:MAG: type II toxin-antitoxin system RelE/ParE family toxin [bacterium]